MSEMVERGAIRLFWRAEHLDPTEEGDVPEDEAFGDTFPTGLSERQRQFWRYLMIAAIKAMREPTEAMIDACHAATVFEDDGLSASELLNQPRIAWNAMIDSALKSA